MLGLLSRLFRISMTPSFITISKNFTPLQSFFLYLNKVICHMCVCVSWTDNEKSSSYLLIIISFIYIAATTCWVYWIAKVTLLLLTIFHLWKGGTLNTWTKRNSSYYITRTNLRNFFYSLYGSFLMFVRFTSCFLFTD